MVNVRVENKNMHVPATFEARIQKLPMYLYGYRLDLSVLLQDYACVLRKKMPVNVKQFSYYTVCISI